MEINFYQCGNNLCRLRFVPCEATRGFPSSFLQQLVPGKSWVVWELSAPCCSLWARWSDWQRKGHEIVEWCELSGIHTKYEMGSKRPSAHSWTNFIFSDSSSSSVFHQQQHYHLRTGSDTASATSGKPGSCPGKIARNARFLAPSWARWMLLNVL